MHHKHPAALTLLVLAATSCIRPHTTPPANEETSAAITPADLQVRLTAFAHDSMMGREAGTYWGEKRADYVAMQFRRLGVKPAGDSGGYFQVVPGIVPRDTTKRRGLAKNVIGIIPGTDPKLRGEFVSITAHNDHIGFSRTSVVDHDSIIAYNTVAKPLGADSPPHQPSAEERLRIRSILDSLRKIHPPRRDSIANGADAARLH